MKKVLIFANLIILFIFISCSKQANHVDKKIVKQSNLKDQIDLSSYISSVEVFHSTYVDDGYYLFKEMEFDMDSICRQVVYYYSLYNDNYPYCASACNNLISHKYYLENPFEYHDFTNYSSEQIAICDFEKVEDLSDDLSTIFNDAVPQSNQSSSEFLSALKTDLLDRLSTENLTLCEEFILKTEIEIFISSANSWLTILQGESKSVWGDFWNGCKYYATADAVSGAANVVANGPTVIASYAGGPQTGLAVTGTTFGYGAVAGSIGAAFVPHK
jgi:hypothetical protein